ncbi:hypothetical protein MW887_004730 [Aspergillus wentii]|nr:hypothetical protein MW887_004730 [Aspergillus wentii]
MSFGYGVGDFLAILKLTNNVRKRFINAPAQFKAVSDDTKTLSNVLRDIEDFHFEAGLDDRQQKHLNNISHDCHCVLQELEDVLDRYQELGPDKGLAGTSRRVWKRIKWDQSEINSVQQRIHGNIKVFNLFLAGLTSHVVFAIQEGVDQINNTLDNQVRQEIINWLAPISYAAQQSDILNRRQAGTGQWLLNTKVFKQWLDNEKQTLFCPGIPGAGKTVLTSVVIDHLEKKFSHNPSIGIAYLYCNFRRHHEQRLEDLAASLLKQLAQRQPLFPDTVRSLYNHHRNTGTRPSLDELLRILYSVTASYSRVFIMVDALDEYNMTSGSLTKFLTELFNMQSKHNINLFATSRHNPVIQSAFENSLIQEIRARNEDVQSYLLSHLHQLPSFVSRNSQLQNEIIEAISESVDGMFLLAHLHLSSLIGKRSPKAIKNTLNKLPCGTDAYDVAYEDAMQRIECQVTDQKEMANQVLSWITCAQRPLTIFELQHALAVEIEESEFDQDNLPDAEDILNACAGLVTIDEESCVIRLVHYTTQEYFERTWIRWFSSAHYGITRVCIAYLSYDVFESGLCATDHDFENRLQEYPLYDYCSQYWGYHTRMQAVEQEWILNLLVDEGKVSSCAQALVTLIGYPQVIRRIHQAPRSVTGVHLAAHFGLETTLRYLIANESICNSPDSTGQMPLSWAAKNGQVKVVRLLLDRFHDPDSKDNDGLTALALTSENGHDEVVKMLLEEGADPNSEDNAGRTPLALAAANGHVSTVNVLLEFNADPETKDTESGWTALSWAAGNGHDEVVMLLLSKGVDLESQDNHGRTPLSWAVDNGHEEVVQSLLDHGAHPDQEDGDGQRPLLYATYNGNEDMVQLLLKHGANLQSTNPGHGLTPLGRRTLGDSSYTA